MVILNIHKLSLFRILPDRRIRIPVDLDIGFIMTGRHHDIDIAVCSGTEFLEFHLAADIAEFTVFVRSIVNFFV